MRGRRARGGGSRGRAHRARRRGARRGRVRAARARPRPGRGAGAGRAAGQPAPRQPPLAHRHPPRRRRRRRSPRARTWCSGTWQTQRIEHLFLEPEARSPSRCRTAASTSTPGPGHLRRPPAGGARSSACPRSRSSSSWCPTAAPSAARRTSRSRPRPRCWRGSPAARCDHAQPRGVDPHAPQAPPDHHGVHGRLRRGGAAHRGASARMVGDSGAYASVGGKVLERAAGHACGPYHVANVDVEAVAVYTNNPPCGAMRGFGANQAHFAMEGASTCWPSSVGPRRLGDPLAQRRAAWATPSPPARSWRSRWASSKTLLAVKERYYAARAAGTRGGHRLRHQEHRHRQRRRRSGARRGWWWRRTARSRSTTATPRWGRGCFTVLVQFAVEVTGLPASRIPPAASTPPTRSTAARRPARAPRCSAAGPWWPPRRSCAATSTPARRLADLGGRVYRRRHARRRHHRLAGEGRGSGGRIKTHTAFGYATQV